MPWPHLSEHGDGHLHPGGLAEGQALVALTTQRCSGVQGGVRFAAFGGVKLLTRSSLKVGREFVISKCDKLPSSSWQRVCSGPLDAD